MPPALSLQDRFLSLAALPTAFKPLPPSLASVFCTTAAKLPEAFLFIPSDATLLDFLALPKVGLAPGLKRGAGAKQRLEKYPRVDWPLQEQRETSGQVRKAPTAVRQVELGRLGSAARILSGESSVAQVDTSVVETLRSKHPEGTPNPFGPLPGPHSGAAASYQRTIS